MKRFLLKAIFAGAGVILASSAGVRADVLYQNTGTSLGTVLGGFNNGQQIGEEIWLGTLVPEYLTNFSFEYYSPDATWTGSPQGANFIGAEIRFYENNGPLFNGYASPGTLFYDSGLLAFPNPQWYNGNSLSNTLTAIFSLSDLQSPPGGSALDSNFVLPTNFTFTITFSGLTGTESVGLPNYNPPQSGTNYSDYWYDSSGTWQLLTNASLGPVAFGAQFNGSPTPTPEPTVLCLGALGGMALGFVARRRQSRG
jgi:hypothetical protein